MIKFKLTLSMKTLACLSPLLHTIARSPQVLNIPLDDAINTSGGCSYGNFTLQTFNENDIQRFINPWTVEVINQKTNEWLDVCLDSPLTLNEAEKRENNLRLQNPNAKFRVVPWLNSSQKQHIIKEFEVKISKPSKLVKWRTGRKVLRTVYENDQLMFLCTTPEDATRIVGLLNLASEIENK